MASVFADARLVVLAHPSGDLGGEVRRVETCLSRADRSPRVSVQGEVLRAFGRSEAVFYGSRRHG